MPRRIWLLCLLSVLLAASGCPRHRSRWVEVRSAGQSIRFEVPAEARAGRPLELRARLSAGGAVSGWRAMVHYRTAEGWGTAEYHEAASDTELVAILPALAKSAVAHFFFILEPTEGIPAPSADWRSEDAWCGKGKERSDDGFQIRPSYEKTFAVTYKGDVDRRLLLAHVLCMMGGIVPLLVAAALAAVFLRTGKFVGAMRRFVLVGFVLLLLGSVPLGIALEYQVFGTYWEGWPFGRDVTDTKSGLMLLLWLGLILSRGRWVFSRGRASGGLSDEAWAKLLIALSVFTFAIYLIPHQNLRF